MIGFLVSRMLMLGITAAIAVLRRAAADRGAGVGRAGDPGRRAPPASPTST